MKRVKYQRKRSGLDAPPVENRPAPTAKVSKHMNSIVCLTEKDLDFLI